LDFSSQPFRIGDQEKLVVGAIQTLDQRAVGDGAVRVREPSLATVPIRNRIPIG